MGVGRTTRAKRAALARVRRAAGTDRLDARIEALEAEVVRLRAALDDEFGQRPRVVTLATLLRRNHARARSVVCRRIDNEGRLYFASDARNGKNGQLRVNGSAEVVCWLPTRKEQYRVAGTVVVIDSTNTGTLRAELWRDLSDATRATFYWPEPGRPRASNPAAFPREVPASVAPPRCFEVLVLSPGQVELLDLKPHPHERIKWFATNDWVGYRVNP